MTEPWQTAPFAPFEWMLSARYLRARRKEGFIAVIAGFSFLGIMLGVATLIIVMAVMNGFRKELLGKILGLNGHILVQPLEQPLTDWKEVAERISQVPGIRLAAPVVDGMAAMRAAQLCWTRACRDAKVGRHRRAPPTQEPAMIIDSQVHAYEANTAKRPWHSVPNWPDHVTGDEMVAAMDKVGVDGAIFISAFSLYRYDASYAVEVQRTHPTRFGIVKPVDPDDPDVADVVANWKSTPGTVGIRIMLTKEAKRDPDHPGLDRIARAAVRYDFPVNILCWGNLDAGTSLIDRHPDTRFIIDHLGILQPRVPPAPQEPWADLPKVLELARRPNAVIKVSGACTLSREPYPFPDIWDPLGRIFDAWGFDRCLWGTDWTRAFAVVNYEQAVAPFLEADRLSDSERTMLMGGACAKAYGWSPQRP